MCACHQEILRCPAWLSHPHVSITHRRALARLPDERAGRVWVTREDHTEDAGFSTLQNNLFDFPACVRRTNDHASRPPARSPEAEKYEEVPDSVQYPFSSVDFLSTKHWSIPSMSAVPWGEMDLEVKGVNGSSCLSGNDSGRDLRASPGGVSTALASVLIFTIVVDILGNVLVILSVYRNKKLRNAGEKLKKKKIKWYNER